ncbi:26S proteasome non-ATPase regulatory subunit 8 [Drosophila madeirensis]|uniref:26S proteasome non-ATPase regulatory subunit 8 n=1 Tax=Drosophila madeirensis TaxID=30013 RepID=A0AAU9EZT8_DROMD
MSNLYKDLKAEWGKRAPNLLRCGELLGLFKQEMAKGAFLMPREALNSNPKQKDQLVRSRDVLEIAVEHSITVKDYAAFERYMAQLNMYYYDYDKFLEPSKEMHKMIGLSLLYMLATNRIADFHIALERLPSDLLLQNSFIMPVLALENYFMEGRYNKILQAKKSMPSEIYGNFMDMLVHTAREEIASCIEKAYLKMSPKQAAQRLGLKVGGKELLELVKRRHWTVDAEGNYDYASLNTKPKEEIPSNEIAIQNLSYATELEKIV